MLQYVYETMSSAIPDRVRRMYNPDIRILAVILLGAIYNLTVFLSNQNFANPYYNFGLAVTVFAIISSVATITYERRAGR